MAKLKVMTLNGNYEKEEHDGCTIGGLDPSLIVLVAFNKEDRYIPYSVTHVPTGMAIKCLPRRLDAIRFAQAFWKMLDSNERLYFARMKAPTKRIDPKMLRKEVIDFVVNYGK